MIFELSHAPICEWDVSLISVCIEQLNVDIPDMREHENWSMKILIRLMHEYSGPSTSFSALDNLLEL